MSTYISSVGSNSELVIAVNNVPQYTVEYHMVITVMSCDFFSFFSVKVSFCLCSKIYGYFLSSHTQLPLVISVIECKLDCFC